MKEMDLRKGFTKDEPIDTIYIGGGTPSTLSTENIDKLVKKLGEARKEFTIECNPDDIDSDFAKAIKNMGINRVSMGAQTFSDKRLNFLHRRHKAEQIPVAVNTLKNAGITNISIDLMFGFPGETLEEWKHDIDMATNLDVCHISAYSLMYEEGTTLYKLLKGGQVNEIDDNCSLEMYNILIDSMADAGFEHYEISNFAKPGYRSIHNSNYWNGTTYIGIGAAAHSYDGMTRQWNISDVDEYIEKINHGIIPCEKETIDADTHYNDLITTALRTKEGIHLNTLSDKHYNYIIRNARKGIEPGLLEISNEHLHLTRKGLFVSDDVMSDLIWV